MRRPIALLLPIAGALLALAGCGGTPDALITEPQPGLLAARPVATIVRPSASPAVELRVVLRAGSAYDPQGKEGLAWLLGHASAEGGTEVLSYPELQALLHPWAAQIAVQVDREQLTFIGRCHRDHAARFVPVFLDVILKPRLAEEDFQRLHKQALAQRVEARTANDEELVKEVLQAVLFQGHPLAHPPLGTEAGLKAVTLADVKAHRAALWTRDRITVGLAGAVDEALADRVAGAFAALPEAGERPIDLPSPPADARRLIIVDQPQGPATAIAFGQHLPVRRGHADFPALSLVASYFGEHRQFHGVLFQRVREARGMNYGDYAYAEAFIQEGWGRLPVPNIARSHQHFSVWIRPVPNADKHFATRLALWLTDGLLKDGLTADQVKATAKFLDGYLALKRQTDLRRLGFAIDDAFYGLQTPSAEWLRAGWAALDAAKVNAALRAHLHPERFTVVVVTPDAQAFKQAVLAEAASPKTYASPKPEAIVQEDAVIATWPLGFTAEQITILPAAEAFAQ
ncbi:MAG: insulinase family protein [Myxococcales bacterium]|nr:insulinase family protein [Myxococcales bacterium]